jgi:hypothetical protein
VRGGTERSGVESHKRAGPICPPRWAKRRFASAEGGHGFARGLGSPYGAHARPCFVYGFLVGMMYDSWHAAIAAQGLLIGCEWVGYRIEEWLQCRGLGKEEE